MSNKELYEALLKGDTSGIVPQSRVEAYLLAIVKLMASSDSGDTGESDKPEFSGYRIITHDIVTSALTADGIHDSPVFILVEYNDGSTKMLTEEDFVATGNMFDGYPVECSEMVYYIPSSVASITLGANGNVIEAIQADGDNSQWDEDKNGNTYMPTADITIFSAE